MEVPVGKQTVIGYPALIDDGETVSLKVFDSAEEAAEAHRKGLSRLFMLQFKEQVKYFDKNVPGITQMAMQYMTLGSSEELKSQLVDQHADIHAAFADCSQLNELDWYKENKITLHTGKQIVKIDRTARKVQCRGDQGCSGWGYCSGKSGAYSRSAEQGA